MWKIEELKNKGGKEVNDTLEDAKRSKYGKEKVSDAISDISMCSNNRRNRDSNYKLPCFK